MSKDILYAKEARNRMLEGVDKLANTCLLYTSDAADE